MGISTRRTCLPLDYIKTTKNRDPRAAFEAALYNNAQTGAAAARMAIERAGLKPEDIGLVISGGSAPDHCSPAEAASVAGELGIEVPCFDLSSACTTYRRAGEFPEQAEAGRGSALCADRQPRELHRVVDYTNRGDAALFGDGTSASIVSAVHPSRFVYNETMFETKPSAWEKVVVPRTKLLQPGRQRRPGIRHPEDDGMRTEAAGRPGREPERFRFIGHQANFGMLKTVCERCGIAEENHWYNVVDYGNTASAGAPGTLSLHWDDLRAGRPDRDFHRRGGAELGPAPAGSELGC